MSFSEDPYHVMTIVLKSNGTYCLLCDSCGGGWRMEYPGTTTVAQFRDLFDMHVLRSHKLSRQDTAEWHKGI